ncbi:DUF6318 family protein [Brachybacterium phenoliresistens]|uniref:DUF6318 family protein n=1 Tax=Brachybacterium phenoliresistens TaxID=396014 RepID=UPI0031D6BF01
MTSRRLLTLGAIAVLTGAACSPPAESPTTAPPTSAESTSPSAAETTPEEATTPAVPAPDPADFPGKDEHTEEGAKQAVRYYWAVLFWGFQTGEHESFSELYSENCANCAGNREVIKDIAKNENPWGPTELQDTELSARSNTDGYEYIVDYYFIVGEHEVRAPGSSKAKIEPAQTYLSAVAVVWSDDKWIVDSIHLELPEAS